MPSTSRSELSLVLAFAATVGCGGMVSPQSESPDTGAEAGSPPDATDSTVPTGSDDATADGEPAPADATPNDVGAGKGADDAECIVPCPGTCTDGRCAEVLSVSGPTGCSLAAYNLAVDDKAVYWVGLASQGTAHDAMKVPLGGGACVTFASGLAPGGSAALGIAVDSTTAYITADTDVVAVPLDGGTPTTLASGQGGARKVAALPLPFTPGSHATNVYWTVDGLGVWMVPVSGGTPIKVSPQPGLLPMGIAVDSLNVYWTTNASGPSGYVWQTPLDGGPVGRLVSNTGGPRGVAADGKNVYWADPLLGTVTSIPVGGGVVTTVASGQDAPSDIALDDAYVYWTNARSVVKAPLVGGVDGGVPITLTTASGGGNIAVDSTSVYYVAGPGSDTPNGGIVKITPK